MSDYDHAGLPFLIERWREVAGLPPTPAPRPMPSLEALRERQWSEPFERRRRARMVMGAFRYGLVGEHRPTGEHDHRTRDCARAAIRRIEMYLETGCQEYLADGANLLMIEYEEPFHPNAHWRTVDDGEHVKDCT